jgi:hypothetical protein
MNIQPEIIKEVCRYRRQVLAEFMDAHPALFLPPAVAHSWIEYFAQAKELNEPESSVAEKALGLFAQVFRQAQYALRLDAPMCLEDFMSTENFPELEEVVVPDPVALFIAGGENPSEHTADVVAFARVISMFKFLVRSGVVSADFIFHTMCRALDNLPGQSALQLSLVEAIKQLLQRDMEIMLRCDMAEPLH